MATVGPVGALGQLGTTGRCCGERTGMCHNRSSWRGILALGKVVEPQLVEQGLVLAVPGVLGGLGQETRLQDSSSMCSMAHKHMSHSRHSYEDSMAPGKVWKSAVEQLHWLCWSRWSHSSNWFRCFHWSGWSHCQMAGPAKLEAGLADSESFRSRKLGNCLVVCTDSFRSPHIQLGSQGCGMAL